MNDKELADRVVALGVGKFYPKSNEHGITVRSTAWYGAPYSSSMNDQSLSAKQFVRDWRVAGVMMELFGNNHDKLVKAFIKALAKAWSIPHQPLPRAIIEDFVKALDKQDNDG